MKLIALFLLLLVVAHIVTLGDVFSALDYADAAGKAAYRDIHPRLEQLDQRIKREYRDAQQQRRDARLVRQKGELQ